MWFHWAHLFTHDNQPPPLKILNLITFAKTCLPSEVTYSLVPGVMKQTSLENHCFIYYTLSFPTFLEGKGELDPQSPEEHPRHHDGGKGSKFHSFPMEGNSSS